MRGIIVHALMDVKWHDDVRESNAFRVVLIFEVIVV
jgi:hypothetical protein